MSSPNKEKQRVSFFIGAAGSRVGGSGAELIIITIANEFAKRGIDVDLLLKRTKGPYMNLISETVNIVNFGLVTEGKMPQLFNMAMDFLWSIHRLHKYIVTRNPQVIITASTYLNLIALIVKKLYGRKLRFVISERCHMSNRSRRRGRTAQLFFVKWLYPSADKVVAVSSGVAEDLIKIVPKIQNKVKVIYNPLDIEKIERLASEDPVHPWFKDRQNQIILGAGGLKRWKAFPVLIKAFAKVRERCPLKLVILGEGPERKKLEKLVSDLRLTEDVSLPGFVENPYAYMSRSSVFVLSSELEGLPNVLLQALACGCPVVSTDCPSGPREILEDGKWGELVPVGDVDAMAEAIERTLEQPLPSEQLKSRARFFSVDKAVNQYLEVALPNCF